MVVRVVSVSVRDVVVVGCAVGWRLHAADVARSVAVDCVVLVDFHFLLIEVSFRPA